ncbi:MAG: cyclic nucleotide-binding domain-containing protein [Myxococcota bacterium]
MSRGGMMEFEFSEADGGQFRGTGKVVHFITGHLGRGEIDLAVGLYESSVGNIGDVLLAEFKASSRAVQKNMANLFYRARDYRRAAIACESMGELGPAAKAYEAALAWDKAADCYLRTGNKDRAAAMLTKAGQPRKAAELYFDAGDMAQAASALEAAGDMLGAAKLSIRAGDQRRAAQQLMNVPPTDGSYLEAQADLADILVDMGRRDVAIQRLVGALPRERKIKDAVTAEVAYKLGVLLTAAGRTQEAQAALHMVRAFNPAYKDTEARLMGLGEPSAAAPVPVADRTRPPTRQPPSPPHIPSAPIPAATTGAVVAPMRSTDPFAALDAATAQAEAAEVQRLAGYELLKKLPIFEDLSIDEMKDFYQLCEQISVPAGEVLIEQGRPGQALYIIREGSIAVVSVEGKAEKPIATLPAGTYVGEMSLIDESPTSARVKAAEPVKAFRIRKDSFRAYLYTHDLVAMRVYRSFTRTLSERLREANAKLAQKR